MNATSRITALVMLLTEHIVQPMERTTHTAVEKSVLFEDWFKNHLNGKLLGADHVNFSFVAAILWEARHTLGLTEKEIRPELSKWLGAIRAEEGKYNKFFLYGSNRCSVRGMGGVEAVTNLLFKRIS